jgi:hypothetical protein
LERCREMACRVPEPVPGKQKKAVGRKAARADRNRQDACRAVLPAASFISC